MNRKITYTKAVELATAFLGQTIEILETMFKDERHCQIYRIEYISGIDHRRKLIAQGKCWSDVFLKLFPTNLTVGWENGIWKQPGYRSALYHARYIGANIGKDTRASVRGTTDKAGDASDNTRGHIEEKAKLQPVHQRESPASEAKDKLS